MEWETLAEIMASPERAPSWLVDGLISEAAVVAIAGEPKTTKTWAGLDLLVSAVTGTKALGKFPARKLECVAAVLAEDHRASAHRRIAALCAGRGVDHATVADRIVLRCRRETNIVDAGHRRELIADLQQRRPGLVMLDPLINVAAIEDENSASAMREAMNALRQIRDEVGATVLFVHHMGKATAGSTRRAGQNMRGSGAIHGAVDGGIYLTGLESDGNVYSNDVSVEVKNARAPDPFRLQLDIRDDDAGRAVSCRWTWSPAQADDAPTRRARR